MEYHPQHRNVADPVQLEESRLLTIEREQASKGLHAANQALQKQIAERTAQLQTVVAELSTAEQRERHRLAQLLHDDLQQQLLGAKRSVDHLQSRQQPDPSLKDLGAQIERALVTLHSFAAQLSPSVLYKGNMREILEWLAGWMWKEYNFAVQVDANPQADSQAEEVRILLFHIVRELLLNVLNHAGTRNARVTLAQAGPDLLEVTVSDNGKGFDPAVKLGQGRFGTGLSLVTFRQRMDLLGGRMDIRSAPGEGTQICLIAPVRLTQARPQPFAPFTPAHPVPAEQPAPQPRPAEPAPPSGDQPTGSRIRVLLADDHAVVRDGLARLLESQSDMDVVAKAANGLEAVDLALELHPDVIVMDANMPLLSGVQAAKRILGELPTAKIIALSMYSVADMDLAMRQAGACEYLTKDSAPDTLVTTIRKHAAAKV